MLVIALGIAVGSATVFGVSMALGAFLAGMVVARSDYSLRAASDALPMRDAFAVLFFVSVGMLLDPASLLDSPWLFLGTLAIVLVVSPATTFLFMWANAAAVQGVPDRRDCPGADRRVLVHPVDTRTRAWPVHDGRSNTIVAASIVSIVVNPLCSIARSIRSPAWVAQRPRLTADARSLGSDRRRRGVECDARSVERSRASRRADRLWSDRANGRALLKEPASCRR